MGAQESAIRKKSEELEVGEEYSKKSAIYSLWSHVNPYTKKKSIKGTIFTKDFGSFVEERKYYENGIKHLKQLRHPHIISFVDCNNVNGVLSLLTERVLILDICIDSLTSIEIQSGLSQIREVLLFLHEKARLCHNNISPASVFVTPNGDWKIGGLEFAQSLDETKAPFQSEFYKRARLRSFAAENPSNTNPVWRDYYGFGKLITYSSKFLKPEEVGEDVINSLRQVAEKLTSSETTGITLCDIYDEVAFSNNLIEIEIFLSTVHLKSEEEKDDFFKSVSDRLAMLPKRVVARRLSRLFLSRYVLLEPRSHTYLYPVVLTPLIEEDSSEGIFPVELFRDYLIPEIVRVFLIRDLSVRCGLLAHFDKYAQYIPVNQLEDFVLDEILAGAHDINEHLVAQSLQAMAVLVPLLGPERVCGWKCTKLFSDGAPKVNVSTHGSTCGSPLPPPPRPAVFKASDKPAEFVQTEHNSIPVFRAVEEVVSPQESNIWNDDKDWNDDWAENTSEAIKDEACQDDSHEEQYIDSASEPQAKIPSNPVNGAHKSTLPNSQTTQIKQNAKIGSEFEIAAQRNKEDDFFADMEPEIKTRGTIIDQLIAKQAEISKKQDGTNNICKFEMDADESAFDTAAWGEDDDDVWEHSHPDTVDPSIHISEDGTTSKESASESMESQNVKLVEEVHMD